MELNEIPSFEELTKTLTSSIDDDKVLPIKEIAAMVKSKSDRFSTGFKVLDEAMSKGFKDGDLCIISGISGEGKTTYAQTLTYHLTKSGVSCLWFSYEVTIDELNKKFIEMGIEPHYEAYAPTKNTSGKLEWIEYKIKEGWVKYATKVIFIDHIDFLTPDDIKNSDSREISLKKIAQKLKDLARDLRVVIIIMAHIKKLSDNKKEPDMQDIGYSAGIFQLADYVFMVSREKTLKKSMGEDIGEIATNIAKIKIVKNRQTGILKFIKLIYANGKFNEIEYCDDSSNN